MCFALLLKYLLPSHTVVGVFLMGKGKEPDGIYPPFYSVRICPRLNNPLEQLLI